jgi:hypothetical protein
MLRKSVGNVKFHDLSLNTRAQIIISRILGTDTTLLFLVLGGGDLEVGLDRENTRRLLAAVQQAISMPVTRNHAWQSAGEAEFSWSDHADQSETGEDYGTILIESNGPAMRIAFRTKKWDWQPYVATFSPTLLEELSTLLSRALSE